MKKKWIKDLGENECVGFNNIEEPEKLVELRPDLEMLVDVNKSQLSKIVIYPNSVLGNISSPSWAYKHEAVHSGHRIYIIDDLLDFQESEDKLQELEKFMGETIARLEKLLPTRPSLDYDEINRLRDEHGEMRDILRKVREELSQVTDENGVKESYYQLMPEIELLLNKINKK